MRKILSLLTAILFAGSLMAADATMAAGTNASSATVNEKAAIKCGTSKAAGDMTITVGAGATKLTVYAAAWKGVTGASIAIAAPEGVTATPASLAITADDGINNNSPFTLAGAEANFKFEVTLTGVTAETALTLSCAKRFVVWGATFDAENGGAAATKTIYCKCAQAWWKEANAAVAVHYWGGASAGTAWPGVRMASVTNQADVWSYDVPADVTGLMFVRVNGTGDVADWGAKTANLTLPTDDKNLYTITSTSAVWGDPGVAGEWSKYGEVTPVDTTATDTTEIVVPEVAVWVLAGNNAALFGSSWSPAEGPEMVMQADSINYVWSKDSVSLAAGDVLFKVVKGHAWGEEYPSENYALAIAEDGVYNVTISFNAATKAINAVAEKVGAAEFDHTVTYYLVGTMNDWAKAEAYKLTASAEAEGQYEITVTLAENDRLKVVGAQEGQADIWYPDGANNDFNITAAYAGEKTVYFRPDGQGGDDWHYGYIYIAANETPVDTTATDTTEIVPQTMTVYFVNVPGWTSVNAYVWPAEGAAPAEWPGEAMTPVDMEINGKAVFAYTFDAINVNIIFNNGEAQTADLVWNAAKPYFYDGAWYALDEIPTPGPTIENGFYLVGTMNDWTPAAEYKFVANEGAEGEYQLSATLAVGDELKVKKVEAGQADVWYPAEGDNYVVDAAHAGLKTIYFRPEYNAEWAAFGGYMYIPGQGEGVENIDADAKTVKQVINGTLFIIRGEKTYTIQGQLVR